MACVHFTLTRVKATQGVSGAALHVSSEASGCFANAPAGSREERDVSREELLSRSAETLDFSEEMLGFSEELLDFSEEMLDFFEEVLVSTDAILAPDGPKDVSGRAMSGRKRAQHAPRSAMDGGDWAKGESPRALDCPRAAMLAPSHAKGARITPMIAAGAQRGIQRLLRSSGERHWAFADTQWPPPNAQ